MLTWARDHSGSGLGAKHRRAQIIVEYQGQENRFMKERLHQHSQLDDGWPESVEEQGLLLLVWRHHITKQYIKDVF